MDAGWRLGGAVTFSAVAAVEDVVLKAATAAG
jgi:hypothetical protein